MDSGGEIAPRQDGLEDVGWSLQMLARSGH